MDKNKLIMNKYTPKNIETQGQLGCDANAVCTRSRLSARFNHPAPLPGSEPQTSRSPRANRCATQPPSATPKRPSIRCRRCWHHWMMSRRPHRQPITFVIRDKKNISTVLTRPAPKAGLLRRARFAFCPMTARAFSAIL